MRTLQRKRSGLGMVEKRREAWSMALRFESLCVSLVTVTRSLWRPLRMIWACVWLSCWRVEALLIRVINEFLVEAMPLCNICFSMNAFAFGALNHI